MKNTVLFGIAVAVILGIMSPKESRSQEIRQPHEPVFTPQHQRVVDYRGTVSPCAWEARWTVSQVRHLFDHPQKHDAQWHASCEKCLSRMRQLSAHREALKAPPECEQLRRIYVQGLSELALALPEISHALRHPSGTVGVPGARHLDRCVSDMFLAGLEMNRLAKKFPPHRPPRFPVRQDQVILHKHK